MSNKNNIQYENIINVSSCLMSQKGYKGASLQEIANAVGIHKSTLFHYFKSKEEILLAVMKTSIDQVSFNLHKIMSNKSYSPKKKLIEAIRNHVDLLLKYRYNVNVFHNNLNYLSKKNKRKYTLARKNYALCFEKLVDEVKEEKTGSFEGLNTQIVTFGILGMCNWLIKWHRNTGEFTNDDITSTFYQMIVKDKEQIRTDI